MNVIGSCFDGKRGAAPLQHPPRAGYLEAVEASRLLGVLEYRETFLEVPVRHRRDEALVIRQIRRRLDPGGGGVKAHVCFDTVALLDRKARVTDLEGLGGDVQTVGKQFL